MFLFSLMLSCFTGQLEVVKLLRKYNAQYDDFDRGGSTALHWAADGGNVKLIDWMIHNGADVNMRDHHSGWTPLLRCGLYIYASQKLIMFMFLVN